MARQPEVRSEVSTRWADYGSDGTREARFSGPCRRGPGGVLGMVLAMGLATSAGACGPPPLEPVAPEYFAFGIFGDGPYYPWENGPWRRTLEDAAAADLTFFVHVGDFLWAPCSDELYRRRLDEMNGLPHPVVYIPGDNEWVDCYGRREGRHDPLERLDALRTVFYSRPGTSLGGNPMPLTTQAKDPAFAGYPEHARWEREGIVFATLHTVGSSNALDDFEGRNEAHDAEVEERTQAVLAWLEETFRHAREVEATGVVLIGHANIFRRRAEARRGHERLRERLVQEVGAFPGPVLYVHGDSHRQRVDQPLAGPSGEPLSNLTRLETFGSPEIGWLRVVMDPESGSFVGVDRRWMRGYW